MSHVFILTATNFRVPRWFTEGLAVHDVEVALTIEGSDAQIHVTDRGVGVPADESDRIFAPFYRTSRTREISGTGLGLHISRRIAVM